MAILIHIYIYYPWRIHGAGIYANIWGILMGSMLPYIAAPWILWVTENIDYWWLLYIVDVAKLLLLRFLFLYELWLWLLYIQCATCIIDTFLIISWAHGEFSSPPAWWHACAAKSALAGDRIAEFEMDPCRSLPYVAISIVIPSGKHTKSIKKLWTMAQSK